MSSVTDYYRIILLYFLNEKSFLFQKKFVYLYINTNEKMKALKKVYYIFIILFRFPSCLIHELFHVLSATLMGSTSKISMNVSFKDISMKPNTTYSFTGSVWKEMFIICSPILGLVIPIILSIFAGGSIINLIMIYQLINIKCSFLSDIDIDVLIDMMDWKNYIKKLGFYDEL